MLVWAASILTAIFGYAGTIKVLEGETPLLMAVLLIATFYIALVGALAVWIVWMYRKLFSSRS